MMRQGDVVWVNFGPPIGSGPALRRPAVIVQSDRFNQSRLATLVVVPLTSNLRRAKMPGNVLLAKGEGNLPKPSVVNVTQIIAIDRSQVTRRLGSLSRTQLREIINGIALILGADALDA